MNGLTRKARQAVAPMLSDSFMIYSILELKKAILWQAKQKSKDLFRTHGIK